MPQTEERSTKNTAGKATKKTARQTAQKATPQPSAQNSTATATKKSTAKKQAAKKPAAKQSGSKKTAKSQATKSSAKKAKTARKQARPARVERIKLDNLIAHTLEAGGVSLVAPDGMGKTTALQAQMESYRARGWQTVYLDAAEADCAWIAEHILELMSTDEVFEATHTLICIDNIPCCEEDEWDVVLTTIHDAAEAGMRFALAFCTHQQYLADCLPFTQVGTAHFCVSYREIGLWGALVREVGPKRLVSYTRGIADFVLPASKALGRGTTSELVQALTKQITCSFEGLLMRDERALRLAMLLLGRGTLCDLSALFEDIDHTLISELAQTDPFFGIDMGAGTFAVVGLAEDGYLAECMVPLSSVAAGWEDLVGEVCNQLVSYGRTSRAALVAEGCLDYERCTHFVQAWPIELINVGSVQLVEEYCSDLPSTPKGFGWTIAQLALAYLHGNDALAAQLFELLGEPATPRQTAMLAQLRMLQVSRQLHMGIAGIQMPSTTEVRTDPIAGALALHARVRILLLQGKILQALEALLICSYSKDGTTLASALLAEDFQLVRALAGDYATKDDMAHLRAAGSFLLAAGLRDQMTYFTCIPAAISALANQRKLPLEMDRCFARSCTRNDSVVQALVLFGYACADLREGATTRAVVRARRVQMTAGSTGMVQLAEAATLIAAVAQCLLGDENCIRELEQGCTDMALIQLALLFEAVFQQDKNRILKATQGLSGLTCSAFVAPVLKIIAASLGQNSELFLAALPADWTSLTTTLERSLASQFPNPPSLELNSKNSASAGMISIQILGSFCVSSGENRIAEDDWHRRSAKLLLMLLAAAEGHSITRGRALEAIWPEADYIRGRGNLYTALSALRKYLIDLGGDHPYITGPDGILRLNPEFIQCDVEEFVNLAHEMLEGEHPDAWIVASCHKIRRIYAGDLIIPSYDQSGAFTARRAQLRRLFVDTMVLGSEAALRIGAVNEAVWYAESSYQADKTREDVLAALLGALSSAGRATEARTIYERYVATLAKLGAGEPAMRIRRALEDAVEQESAIRE